MVLAYPWGCAVFVQHSRPHDSTPPAASGPRLREMHDRLRDPLANLPKFVARPERGILWTAQDVPLMRAYRVVRR